MAHCCSEPLQLNTRCCSSQVAGDSTAQTVTMRFESFADYWDPFLLGQGPAGVYVTSLSPDRVRVLRSEVKSRVSPSAENLPFALSARVWSVCGTVPGRV